MGNMEGGGGGEHDDHAGKQKIVLKQVGADYEKWGTEIY